MTASARAVIEGDAAAVAAVAALADGPAFAALAAAVPRAGRVVVTGAGTSGAIARRAAHLLALVGCPAFFIDPSEGLHGGLGAVQAGDLVIALSRGGASAEVNDFCAIARGRGAGLAVLTAAPGSALAGMADHLLALPLPPGTEMGGFVATGSSLAMGALLDALTEAVRQARGTPWAALLDVHPAGAVGRDAGALRKADADA